MHNNRRKVRLILFLAWVLSETALFLSMCRFWSGFPWSPFGNLWEKPGFLLHLLLIWPALLFSYLLRRSLFMKWRTWKPSVLSPFLYIVAVIPFGKSAFLGGLCLFLMVLAVPIDIAGMKKIRRRYR